MMKSAKLSIDGHLIDEYCPIQGQLVNDNDIYSCILNQTDINSNKNKFYIMQLISEANNPNNVTHFIRYGRIGQKGQIINKSYNLSSGKQAFEKTFKNKTGNNWNDRNSFKNVKGKYFLSEISYKEILPMTINIPIQGEKIPSKLDVKVQELIGILADVNMMNDTLIKMDIDTKKLPLGKLKYSQLEKADQILNLIHIALSTKKVQSVLSFSKKYIPQLANSLSSLVDYSNQYYTLIPFDCGRNVPPIIDNIEMVSKCRSVIEDLKNMVIGIEIINKADNNIDSIYDALNTEIQYLNPKEQMHSYITNYFNNTHGHTHQFKLTLKDIYQVKRLDIDEDAFHKKKQELGNVQLLIHGSRLSNWASILKNNLLLDPSKLGVHIAGKMFGYGIYFANSFSKSAQYCGIDYGSSGLVCFALAEVALGNSISKTDSDSKLNKKFLEPKGYHSCFGIGQMTPSSYVLHDNVYIPQGNLSNSNIDTILTYDEKIVYDTDQFAIKYLVIAQMTN
jgi:predicted DNA-binding WGR domain protein